ncbi:LLM class flavin-dependent oxidoreductase [Pelagovum pacificum]|uniref:Luciferase-like monooxygenase n=1 Tax=Pelagovum pacificum TaxID=2588711 RepID=A0A5C5GGF5_9RHOB|nr:LLM class flavin-dependent oxidoreductase [Pelagovum pacificum]QQA43084.1 LLM class flavin-dependent oxidoreductase [Pelagovum pacificum]TNY33773.1 LLM class flavin-dependent oxidoreductase [Pelagovum pacificum]
MHYSVLDLSPVPEGQTTRQAIANTVDLAQKAEGWGYHRYWMAEHHNMPGIASAATSVLIGHVADATKTMRVGAGGIMLPNHAPLAVAEAFGTLATIHGDRIDLGLGRAPGGDMAVARALRATREAAERFPESVIELLGYLGPEQAGAQVAAHPGQGTEVPIWILGSSLFGAQLAAQLGLPYAFASHFAPDALDDASTIYRRYFQPTKRNPKPKFMLAVNVFAAPTDEEGRFLQSTMKLAFARLRTGRPGKLPAPVEDLSTEIPEAVMPGVDHALRISAVGSPDTVRRQLGELIDRYAPDEVILTGQIHDHAARLRSFEIAAQAMAGIGSSVAA